MLKIKKDYDVIIVGSGPTGLMTANLLGQYDISTLLVEKNESISQIPKAILIDDETLRICQSIGLEKEVNEIITSGGGAKYYASPNDKPFTTVEPKVGQYGYYARNKFLQPDFEGLLLKSLERFPSVEIRFNTELKSFNQIDDSTVEVKLDNNNQFTSQFLLGCDGGRSTVRKKLGITFKDIGNKKGGSSFEQPWIILDLKNDKVASRHTSFYCDPPRPSMHSATARGQRRYEFMLLPGENHEEMLTDESLGNLVSPFTEYKSEDVVKKAVITFNALIANQFQKGNVLLLGDSAHLTPPFAGQGLNSGIRDAFNVSWKISLIVKKVAHPSIIKSYQEERKEHVESMIKLAVNMGNFILTTSRERQRIRNTVFNITSFVPPIKRYITEMRFKPKPICKEGVFVDIKSDPLIGSMLVQPKMMFEDSNIKLFDEVLNVENNFTILKVGASNEISFPKLNSEIWKKLNPDLVSILPKDYLPYSENGSKVVTDINGTFKNYNGKFILLRPDRYVAGVFTEGKFEEFSNKLKKIINENIL